jgi:hypothetical protein
VVQITVSDDFARQIAGAPLPIVLVDSHGRALGQINRLEDFPVESSAISDEDWAEIQRRMANDDGTRYSWAEVKQHLRSLVKE